MNDLHPEVVAAMLSIELAFDVAERVDRAMVDRMIGDSATVADLRGWNSALLSLFHKEDTPNDNGIPTA